MVFLIMFSLIFDFIKKYRGMTTAASVAGTMYASGEDCMLLCFQLTRPSPKYTLEGSSDMS